jgi:peptidoglycan/LPS O-acetylase OafA/YrhL
VKFRYLDGLRGIAALIVVLDHFAIAFFQRATDASIHLQHAAFEDIILKTPLHLLVSGNFSVCIFFVVSGFVLGAKFFRTGKRSVVVASAWRRYARLELPVLASVLLSYAVIRFGLLHSQAAAAITGSTWLHDLWHITPSLPGALYHAAIGVFVDGASQYNTVLWTMQTELVGSFLAFGLLLAVGRWRYRWLVYAGLAVVLLNSYLLCFVAGIAMCDWYMARAHKAELPKPVWIPLVASSLLLGSVPVGMLAGTMFSGLPSWLGYGMNVSNRLHILGAVGLVCALMATPLLQKAFEWRPALALGRISFGLYLTHLLVIGSFSCWLFTLLEPALGYTPGFIGVFAVSVVLIGAVAYAFSRWVDEPAMRVAEALYRRHFPKRWQPKAEIAEAPLQTPL